MSTPFVITCCMMLLISRIHCQDACADLDTQACVRMNASQLDLCGTALADSVCPAYCGKCSGERILTTTRASCEDIDTLACQQMHSSKPDLCLDDSIAENACKRFCGRCPVECYSCPTLVNSLSECRATTMCQVSEVCYVMEVVDFDTSHGFRAGCMPKDLCIPPSNEQIVGRSSSTVHTKCCDTDRCNIPSTTTTTTTATTTTRLTPSSNCYDNINVNCNALFACALHPLKCARTCGHCR